MDDEVIQIMNGLDKIIDDIPLAEGIVKIMRELIELRTIIEIAEAFTARRDKLALDLHRDVKRMEHEYPGKTE